MILVVDDNVDNAEQIIDFLQETDKSFTFFQALNGKVAYSVAEKKLPDLIITDWDMPVMNGIELIKHLKSNESTKDIPVIMCTGVMTKTENLKTALDAGAIDYIRKPVEKLELIARVHSMLKLSETLKTVKEQNNSLIEQKQEIEEKNTELANLNATKDKFFSIIAHDLKNPFNVILGFCNLIIDFRQNIDTQKIKQYVEKINNSALNAYKLLENLLEWARLQTLNIEPKILKEKPSDLINEVIMLSEQMSKSKNIDLQTVINCDDFILADKEMVKTILRNLVTNALKFTKPEGSVKIETQKLENDVIFTVSDNGIGIESEHINKLFRIDSKLSKTGTANEKGTGLGLILCKEFVEKNNGKIWVESEVGKGSDFKFTLPLSNPN